MWCDDAPAAGTTEGAGCAGRENWHRAGPSYSPSPPNHSKFPKQGAWQGCMEGGVTSFLTTLPDWSLLQLCHNPLHNYQCGCKVYSAQYNLHRGLYTIAASLHMVPTFHVGRVVIASQRLACLLMHACRFQFSKHPFPHRMTPCALFLRREFGNLILNISNLFFQ